VCLLVQAVVGIDRPAQVEPATIVPPPVGVGVKVIEVVEEEAVMFIAEGKAGAVWLTSCVHTLS
jgi:hypothetical protein